MVVTVDVAEFREKLRIDGPQAAGVVVEELSHHDFGMYGEHRSHFMDDVRHPFVEICERLLVEADEIVDERCRIFCVVNGRGHGDFRKVLVFSLQCAVQRRDVMVLRLQPGGPLRLEDGQCSPP